MGNLTPRGGHVRLDGMDMAHWESRDRGHHVGFPPQGVGLFAGTVRDNIARMARVIPTPSSQLQIWRACTT